MTIKRNGGEIVGRKIDEPIVIWMDFFFSSVCKFCSLRVWKEIVARYGRWEKKNCLKIGLLKGETWTGCDFGKEEEGGGGGKNGKIRIFLRRIPPIPRGNDGRSKWWFWQGGCSDAISRWICLRSPLRSPLTLPFYPLLLLLPAFTLPSPIRCSWLPSRLRALPPSISLADLSSRSRPHPLKITCLSTMSHETPSLFKRSGEEPLCFNYNPFNVVAYGNRVRRIYHGDKSG